MVSVTRERGRGRDAFPGLRGLVFQRKMRHPAGGGRLGALGAVSSFLRDVAWWPVRSDNPYHVLAYGLAKKGSAW